MSSLGCLGHPFLDTQVLEPAVRAVVNNFVSERNSSEVMAVG